jgi:hypothetical protein
MVFDQSLLGPTPESLQAVDVDLAGREVLLVVHLQVSVAAEHEAVVASKLIRVDHTASTHLFDGELEQRGGRDIRNDVDMHQTIPLQDAEDRHFAGRAPRRRWGQVLYLNMSGMPRSKPSMNRVEVQAPERKIRGQVLNYRFSLACDNSRLGPLTHFKGLFCRWRSSQ